MGCLMELYGPNNKGSLICKSTHKMFRGIIWIKHGSRIIKNIWE